MKSNGWAPAPAAGVPNGEQALITAIQVACDACRSARVTADLSGVLNGCPDSEQFLLGGVAVNPRPDSIASGIHLLQRKSATQARFTAWIREPHSLRRCAVCPERSCSSMVAFANRRTATVRAHRKASRGAWLPTTSLGCELSTLSWTTRDCLSKSCSSGGRWLAPSIASGQAPE